MPIALTSERGTITSQTWSSPKLSALSSSSRSSSVNSARSSAPSSSCSSIRLLERLAQRMASPPLRRRARIRSRVIRPCSSEVCWSRLAGSSFIARAPRAPVRRRRALRPRTGRRRQARAGSELPAAPCGPPRRRPGGRGRADGGSRAPPGGADGRPGAGRAARPRRPPSRPRARCRRAAPAPPQAAAARAGSSSSAGKDSTLVAWSCRRWLALSARMRASSHSSTLTSAAAEPGGRRRAAQGRRDGLATELLGVVHDGVPHRRVDGHEDRTGSVTVHEFETTCAVRARFGRPRPRCITG